MKWEIQGEYIQADLENQKSYGYYAFADYDFDKMNGIVVSTERLQVLIPSYSNEPWYILGYSHFFDGQKEKVMVDARTQYLNDQTNYGATIQLQVFFN